jgi:hypothetical protein
MLPPRCGFIPAGNESPFDRRVAQGCSDNWGRGRAFIGDHCGEPVESCEQRGSTVPEPKPTLRGSYCEGSDQDLVPPSRALGSARISGYIAAGARFGSEERIGGRSDPFAPIDEPGIAGGQASGLTIVGAPAEGKRFLLPASPSDAAR